jgi:hypothetical protein
MGIHIIRSEYVCLPKGIGILFESGFIRIMLIWWNVVIRFGEYRDGSRKDAKETTDYMAMGDINVAVQNEV